MWFIEVVNVSHIVKGRHTQRCLSANTQLSDHLWHAWYFKKGWIYHLLTAMMCLMWNRGSVGVCIYSVPLETKALNGYCILLSENESSAPNITWQEIFLRRKKESGDMRWLLADHRETVTRWICAEQVFQPLRPPGFLSMAHYKELRASWGSLCQPRPTSYWHFHILPLRFSVWRW